jgi:Domain of Unknown Function (DUF1080)
MNYKSIVLVITCCAFANTSLYSQPAEEGFTSMFNGKDLTGWDGLPELWKVQDGAIVGETKKISQQTIFLYWKGGEPADFEMRCRLRISGREANSGIQFRSIKLPNWNTSGYQADFDVSGYCVGNLYLYERQPFATFAQRGDSVLIDSVGNRTVSNFANKDKLLDAYKKGDWNEYWIVAKGSQVSVWLNGVLMSKVEDHEAKYVLSKGIIALQLHSGEPMRVEFKDLRIRQY